jgi:hypothetical protein
MASTFATDASASNQIFSPPGGGIIGVREATYEISAALVLNDVIQMVKVHAGEEVVDIQLITDDLDTDGSPAILLDVGDGDNPDRYIDGATVGQGGGIATIGSGITADAQLIRGVYSADDTIDVKVATAPATGATSGTITLRVFVKSK